MTRPTEEQDERTDWFAQELGEEWRSQGDGTYRFVGTPEARARGDEETGAVEELEQPHASDEPLTREPRQPRLPWRRR
jgi:hypothetical protein